MQPKVCIVISTWNRLEMLKQVIESIYKQDYKNFEIIVVDNHSNDGTAKYIDDIYRKRQEFRWDFFYKVMPHSNYTAMQTLNEGFRIALDSHEPRYILVMDDDCVMVEIDTITRLVKDIQSRPNVGMVATNVIGPIEPLPLLEFKYPMTKVINIRELPKELFRTYDFIGCCSLFDAKIFEQIGLYDESFSIYWNEADTALKMLYASYDVLYDPALQPIHYISQLQRQSARGWFYYVRNGNIIINRFMSLRNRLVLVPMRSMLLLIRGADYYRDPRLIIKTALYCCVSLLNIFWMPSRVTPCNTQIYAECNESYAAFHFRKFYEWLTGYPVIKL